MHSSDPLINTVIVPFCLNLIKANFQHHFFKSLKSEFMSYDLLICSLKYISTCLGVSLSKLVLFSTEFYISTCTLDLLFHVPMYLQHPCSCTGGQVTSLIIPTQQVLCCQLQCCAPEGLEVLSLCCLFVREAGHAAGKECSPNV